MFSPSWVRWEYSPELLICKPKNEDEQVSFSPEFLRIQWCRSSATAGNGAAASATSEAKRPGKAFNTKKRESKIRIEWFLDS